MKGYVMFTPEFINEERGEFLLVANHALASPESIKLSIAYNIARISLGMQLPPHIQTCRVVYDIRGNPSQIRFRPRSGKHLSR
jgi:hypothetical protein